MSTSTLRPSTPEEFRLARIIVTAMCQGCQGTGYLSEVDIGVGTMREPCGCTGEQSDAEVAMVATLITKHRRTP